MGQWVNPFQLMLILPSQTIPPAASVRLSSIARDLWLHQYTPYKPILLIFLCRVYSTTKLYGTTASPTHPIACGKKGLVLHGTYLTAGNYAVKA